jgi:hypothetical protein
VDSTCFYYDIYDKPAALYLDLKTLSKQVPRERSSCDQTQKLYFNLYEGLTKTEKTLRHVCYPKQNEVLSSQTVPQTSAGSQMVRVDKENSQLVWIDKGAPELNNKSWSVQLQEFADNDPGSVYAGFNLRANYQFKRVSHFNVQFEASNPKGFTFFPQDMASDFRISVSCWSSECPGYIKQNANSLYPEINNERVSNNTYVYYVESTQLSKVNVTRFTVSFNITKKVTADPKISGINITGDFQEWY